MEIVVAEEKHLDAMASIVERAKAAMAARGLDQWQRGYPDRAVLEADVAGRAAYAAIDGSEVVGLFCYREGPEESYERIEGAWRTDGPYAAVHRLAVDPGLRGRGIAGALLDRACETARAGGLASVRVDTHADNAPMRRAVEKAGFEPRGTIRLIGGPEDGAPRLAYERAVR